MLSSNFRTIHSGVKVGFEHFSDTFVFLGTNRCVFVCFQGRCWTNATAGSRLQPPFSLRSSKCGAISGKPALSVSSWSTSWALKQRVRSSVLSGEGSREGRVHDIGGHEALMQAAMRKRVSICLFHIRILVPCISASFLVT